MTAIRIMLTSALVTAALIKGAPTAADPISAQSVSIVHTADLDLSRKADRHELDRRLAIAAREVCGTAADVDLAGRNQVRACRTNVLTDARTKVEQFASRREDLKIASR